MLVIRLELAIWAVPMLRSRTLSPKPGVCSVLRPAGPSVAMSVEVDVDVLEAVSRLSVQQRAAVLLTYWEDLSAEAVAERMGVSIGSVKRQLARARGRLQEWLS